MTVHRSESNSLTFFRRMKKRSKTSRILITSLVLSVGYVVYSVNQDSSYHRATSDLSQLFPSSSSDFFASIDTSKKATSSSTTSIWDSFGIAADIPIPNSEEWSCTWFPDDHTRCDEILSKITNDDAQRWIFFGDSTMKRLFNGSDLKKHLISQPRDMNEKACLGRVSCEEHQQEDRCELNSVYGLPNVDQDEWISPDPTKFEGPIRYGLERGHQSCTDCRGCQTHFLECSFDSSTDEVSDCNSDRRVYGGYMTMEFARDRELQTPEFGTTQENIASYLSQTWNAPELIREWGKPICVFSGGNHDIILPGIRRQNFIDNVQWMLNTLQSECHHFIWLSNTPNKKKLQYPQHLAIMKSWDRGVKELIAGDQELVR